MAARIRGWFYRVILATWLTRFYDRSRKHLTLGELGEIQAERFLLKLGWIILARGFTTAAGEIDLIAVDQGTVVFVEVKTRRNTEKGLPVDAVDLDKQRQISRLASAYIRSKGLGSVSVRCDVLSILWDLGNSPPQITHYRNAFDGCD